MKQKNGLCTQTALYDISGVFVIALLSIIQMKCTSIFAFPKNLTAIIIESFQLLCIVIIRLYLLQCILFTTI